VAEFEAGRDGGPSLSCVTTTKMFLQNYKCLISIHNQWLMKLSITCGILTSETPNIFFLNQIKKLKVNFKK